MHNTDGAARRHAQIGPHLVDILFLDSHHGNAGGPGDLQSLGLIFFGNIRKLAEQGRGYDPAGNMGGDGIGLVVPLEDGAFFT